VNAPEVGLVEKAVCCAVDNLIGGDRGVELWSNGAENRNRHRGGEAGHGGDQGNAGDGVGAAMKITEDGRRVTADQRENSGTKAGDLTTPGAQGLSSALLVLEQALGLFDDQAMASGLASRDY
jgi:hypothetical protein